MKFLAFSSTIALSFLAGCAVESTDEAAQTEDAIVRRPVVELEMSSSKESVQAKLHALLKAFAGDADLGIGRGIERGDFVLNGKEPTRVSRQIVCTESNMELVGPGGTGWTQRSFHACTLEGFDQVRNGAQLPRVIVPFGVEAPLAGKLVTLLDKGATKGGFGVKRSEPAAPTCCDIPTTSTYEISDESAALVCTLSAGGFTNMRQAQCTLSFTDTTTGGKGTTKP